MDKIDLPCIKYIVPRLESEEDVLSFCTTFYKIFLKLGYTDEQIATEYISRTTNLATAGVDLFTLNGEKYEPVELMRTASLVTSSVPKLCKDYAKTALDQDFNNICNICSMNKNTVNDFEDEEYSILRYVCESGFNRDEVRGLIGSSKCVFKTSMDIAQDLDFRCPVVVNVTSLLYYQIGKSPSFYKSDYNTAEDRLMYSPVKNHFVAAVLEKNPVANELVSKYPAVTDVVYKMLVDRIMAAKLCASDEIGVYIDKITSKRSRVRPVVPPKSKVMDNGQMSMFDQPEYTNALTDITKIPEPVSEPVEQTVDVDSVEQVAEEPVVEEVSEVSSDETPEEYYDSLISDALANEEFLDNEENVASDVPTENVSPENDRSADTSDRVTEPDDNGNPLYIPMVYESWVRTIPDYSTFDRAIFDSAVKERMFSFSVLRSASGYYYLIYIPSINSVVKASVDNPPKSLCAILTSKKVVKITWEPFYVSSKMRQVGYGVNNIHSIYCEYMYYYPSVKYGGYKDVMMHVVGERVRNESLDSLSIDIGSKLASAYIFYLPMYSIAYKNQVRSEFDKSKRGYYDLFMDCLRYSYLLSNNFRSDDRLFRIDVNGRYIWNDRSPEVVLREGNLLSYAINCKSLTSDDIQRIYEYVLTGIVQKGYFKKFNIQLVRLHRDNMIMFCEDYAYDALKTYIRMSIDNYALSHGYKNFDCVSGQRHCIPAGADISINQKQYPTTLSAAQTSLTTVYDKITVDNERIRVTRSSHQRQKGIFPQKVSSKNK